MEQFSRMEQVKYVEDSLKKFDGHGMLQAGHTHSNFVKIVFHNFYLVHS